MPDKHFLTDKDFSTHIDQELDLAYNPSNWPSRYRSIDRRSRDALLTDYIAECTKGSRLVYTTYSKLITTIKYGDRSNEEIDILSPVPPMTSSSGATLLDSETVTSSSGASSLLAFLHGGYWQDGHFRSNSMHLALPTAQAGHYFAGIGYLDSSVQLSLSEEVDQVIAAVNRLADYAVEACIGSIILSGHSAGAHLVAMTVISPKLNDNARRIVQGTALLSGVYDIVPLLSTTINIPGLGLQSESAALQLSPMYRMTSEPIVVENLASNLIAYGEDESEAFRAQSRRFAKVLDGLDVPHKILVCPGKDHFSLITDSVSSEDVLAKELLAVLNRSGQKDISG